MGAAPTRYSPSRNYLWAGIAAVGLAGLSFATAVRWLPAAIPAVLFVASALLLFFLFACPPIELYKDALAIGKRRIPWKSIRKVDGTGWISPLVLRLTLEDGAVLTVVYPGDLDSANSLLRHIRRLSREEVPAVERESLSSPKYQLLRQEDEDEVERLFRRLKTVGHLDQKNNPDDK